MDKKTSKELKKERKQRSFLIAVSIRNRKDRAYNEAFERLIPKNIKHTSKNSVGILFSDENLSID